MSEATALLPVFKIGVVKEEVVLRGLYRTIRGCLWVGRTVGPYELVSCYSCCVNVNEY